MPSFLCETNVELSKEAQDAFLTEASKTIGDCLSKPESFCMVSYKHANMMFGGTSAPTSFVQILSLGSIGPDQNKTTAERIFSVLEKHLGVPSNRCVGYVIRQLDGLMFNVWIVHRYLGSTIPS
ncbi:unnamed protein product [Chrysoparadoxa australica]